jgi:hypothetical protein
MTGGRLGHFKAAHSNRFGRAWFSLPERGSFVTQALQTDSLPSPKSATARAGLRIAEVCRRYC